MTSFLKTKIITVKSLILELDASLVILPAEDGEIGILPDHVPMLVKLKPGQVKIFANNAEYKYFIFAGFAEITARQVNVLTSYAQDLAIVSKKEILGEIDILKDSLEKEIHDHNIKAIKLNLDKQQALLKHL